MKIWNLTQHPATPEQIAAGVVDLPPSLIPSLQRLLTFEDIPSNTEMIDRSYEIAELAAKAGAANGDEAMIGGAPFFMSTLERTLMVEDLEPVYAFSKRDSIEEVQPDGTTVKRSVFRHAGWVRP